MRRIAILNFVIGFSLIFVAACGGAFVALKSTESYIHGAAAAPWELVLQASSHGHTNLFGMIHIMLGITMPYCRATIMVDRLKTFCLSAGSFAMGPLLLMRASTGPSLSTDALGVVIGSCLTLALGAILAHILGLCSRLMER